MNILFLLLQSLLFYKNEMPKPIRGGSDLSVLFNSTRREPRLRYVLRVFSTCSMNFRVALGKPEKFFNLSLDFFDDRSYLFSNPPNNYRPGSRADPAEYERRSYKIKDSATFVSLHKNFSEAYIGSGFYGSDLMMTVMPSKYDADGIFPLRHAFLLLEIVDGSFAFRIMQKPVDGKLGIGSPSLNTLEGVPTFIGSLKNLLKMPTMTFHFKFFNANDPDEMKQRSEAVMGIGGSGLEDLCNSTGWLNLPSISKTAQWSWSMAVQKMSIKGLTFVTMQTAIIYPNDFYIRLPDSLMAKLALLLNATEEIMLHYVVDCNQRWTAPNISFTFVHEDRQMDVTFTAKDYILESYSEDNCELIFSRTMDMYEGYWMLGYAFFKHHCLQFNFSSTPTIGFTPIIMS